MWFNMRARAPGNAEITIFDEIGSGGVAAKDFDMQLKALGKVSNITLRINSPGGGVFDGLAIFNMLKRHPAHVTVYIDGVAASIASLIAMAGDEIIMPENAMMMIHDPSGMVLGTSSEMRHIAESLDQVKESIITAYTGKTGLDRNRVAELMSDETWLTAARAVELGFADRVEEPVRFAANFDLSKFEHPPQLPKTIEEYSDKFWAGVKKPAPLRVSAKSVEDLDADAIYARWNRASGREGGAV